FCGSRLYVPAVTPACDADCDPHHRSQPANQKLQKKRFSRAYRMLVQVYCRTEIGSLRLNEASPTSGIGSGVSRLLKRRFLKFTTARKMAEGTAFAVTLVAFLL